MFCIHFHGNACDIGQVSICAARESSALHAHYLLVEYPGFGLSNGYASEVTVNQIAISVYNFVHQELKIPSDRIVLIGRSIGTGPVCYLASHLQAEGKPPLAVILHSPYASIRDAAFDLLGSISTCMFDRWPNWRYLVGDMNDPTVIQCPVLFIHADNDKVIPCQHSLLLHEQRLKRGLPSDLFIQHSTGSLVKGHNYFDYEQDVVIPSRNFLHRLLPLDLQSLPTLILPQDVLQRVMRVPPEYKGFGEEFLTKADNEKPSKYTTWVISCWLCCPCLFCAEGCLACLWNNVPYLSEPSFNYKQLRPQQMSHGGLMQAVFHRKSFDRLVNEDEAAKSLQNALIAKREGREVQNPMISGVEDVRKQRHSRTEASVSPTTASCGESDSEKVSFPPALVLPHASRTSGVPDESTDQSRASINYVPG
eukprot:scaffold146_cov171-Ochromonas_danica.AAC.8